MQRVASGYYTKLVGDTLTQKELKRLAAEIVELKKRKPVSVTKTVVQPVKIIKETDSITRDKDTFQIKDFYPDKNNPFLTYTNRFDLNTLKGTSDFDFGTVTLNQVVTDRGDGLFQIDFKGPEFLEVKSIDVQTTPMKLPDPDKWGTLLGVEFGQNLDSNKKVLGVNVYERYKKFYFGGSFNTNKDLMGGIKIEL